MESFNDVFTAVKARCKSSINEASYNLFIAPIELWPYGRADGYALCPQ